MSATRKVVFFFNGTIATRNQNPKTYLGFFASYFMFDKNNSVLQLFENCEEENIYHFDGPGADICNDEVPGNPIYKMVTSVGGMLNGHVGTNSIENTLAASKKILLEQAQKAGLEGKKLEIHAIGWSRGAFVAWRFKKELADMIADHNINVESLYLIYIDTVPGGPFDRWNLLKHSNRRDPDIKIYSRTYISHSGNPRIWPEFLNFNMPFFSGFLSDEKDHQNTLRIIVAGNHEALVGKYGYVVDPKHPEVVAGTLVLWDIVRSSTLIFKEVWKEKVLEQGRMALTHAIQQNVSPKNNRKYLSTTSCFFGEPGRNFIPITYLAGANQGDLSMPAYRAHTLLLEAQMTETAADAGDSDHTEDQRKIKSQSHRENAPSR